MTIEATIRKRQLRHNATPAEILFWSKVCNKQFKGLKFRRQHDIGSFIVDFYCPDLKLVVEIDGDSHYTKEGIEYDRKRSSYLESKGTTIIRYNNNDVLTNIDGVFLDLESKVQSKLPSPNLSLEGRGIDQTQLQT